MAARCTQGQVLKLTRRYFAMTSSLSEAEILTIFFLRGDISLKRSTCQLSERLVKFAVLLRSARTAQWSKARDVFRIATLSVDTLRSPKFARFKRIEEDPSVKKLLARGANERFAKRAMVRCVVHFVSANTCRSNVKSMTASTFTSLPVVCLISPSWVLIALSLPKPSGLTDLIERV